MSSKKQQDEPQESFNVADIYYVLFRQKKIILAFSAMGILAAAALYVIKPARYESQAGVYIQYIKDSTFPKQSGGDDGSWVTPTGQNISSIITTELEFLSSQELSRKVAAEIGPDKILAKVGGGNDINAAMAVIQKGLMPDPVPKGSIVRIAFQHPDADIAQRVLAGVINAYVARSAYMHRPVGADNLTNDIAMLTGKLEQTETELRKVCEEAGIVSSLDETKKDLDARIDETTRDIGRAEAQLAAHEAPLKEASKNVVAVAPTTNAATNAETQIPAPVLEKYKDTCELLAEARAAYKREQFNVPAGSLLLTPYQRRVKQFEDDKQNLEKQFPALATMAISTKSSTQPGAPYLDLGFEANEVLKLRATTNALRLQLERMKGEQRKIAEKEPVILALLLQQKLQKEACEVFLKTSMEHALSGDGKSSDGIKINEPPTTAVKTRSKKFKKLVMMALGGGIGGGIAFAFIIEMVFDRSVRRPDEIEKKLKLPLFITIPDVNGNGHRKPAALRENGRLLLRETSSEALVPVKHDPKNGNGNGDGLAPWDARNSLRPFYEGLRDRLIVNFEVRNLTHNPKLVGVTSCNKGAGVSSIAAGLAASLSETGDGNVLLVDMRGEQGAAQHFYKGKPGCGLDAALEAETKNNAMVRDNLYVASEGAADAHGSNGMPKRFASLMPKLKASEYDYIIFDMPPVSQTSATPRMSGLMDMVLLVIESEKTTKDAVQRANKLLSESKANVSTVLNKVHSYVPRQLHDEMLDGV